MVPQPTQRRGTSAGGRDELVEAARRIHDLLRDDPPPVRELARAALEDLERAHHLRAELAGDRILGASVLNSQASRTRARNSDLSF